MPPHFARICACLCVCEGKFKGYEEEDERLSGLPQPCVYVCACTFERTERCECESKESRCRVLVYFGVQNADIKKKGKVYGHTLT